MSFPIYNQVEGLTITLAVSATPSRLLDLIKTVQTGSQTSPSGQNTITTQAPYKTRWMRVQIDPSSAGDLLFGSGPRDTQGNVNPAALSASNYGMILVNGLTPPDRETFDGIRAEDFNLSSLYVMASTDTAVFNVLIYRG